jgi:hypothetical protein
MAASRPALQGPVGGRDRGVSEADNALYQNRTWRVGLAMEKGLYPGICAPRNSGIVLKQLW